MDDINGDGDGGSNGIRDDWRHSFHVVINNNVDGALDANADGMHVKERGTMTMKGMMIVRVEVTMPVNMTMTVVLVVYAAYFFTVVTETVTAAVVALVLYVLYQ